MSFAEIIDQELEHGPRAQKFIEEMMSEGYEVRIIQETLLFKTVHTDFRTQANIICLIRLSTSTKWSHIFGK